MKFTGTIFICCLYPYILASQNASDTSILSSNQLIFNPQLIKDSLNSYGRSYKISDSTIRMTNKDKIKSRITTVNLFSFHGNASIDLYSANAQNPNQLNQSQYVRFYINPTVTLLGLPFTSNIFLTTENNNFFNSNSISFRFDAEAYKREMTEKYRKKWKEEQKSLGTKNTDLYNTDRIIEQQKKVLEKEQKKLDILDQILEQKSDEIIRNTSQNIKDSIDNLSKSGSEIYNDSIKSSTNSYLENFTKFKDSLNRIKTIQMNRINEITQTIEQIQNQKDSIILQIEQYKSQVDKYSRLMKDPLSKFEQGRNQIGDSLSSKKNRFLPKASDIQHFDFGLFYASQTEFTTLGLPVKGLNIQLSPNKWKYGISVGKTISSFNNISRSKQEFDRNLTLFTFGYKFNKYLQVLWNGGFIWDEALNNQIKKTNQYSSLTIEQEFLNLKIKIEAAYSKIQTSGGYLEQASVKRNSEILFNDRLSQKLAYKAIVEYHFHEKSVLTGTYKKVPLTYLTLGNPFMRRDYIEYEVSFKQKLFKNKLHADLFYKENRNNLNSFETYTTKAKGYGITIQTNFNSIPNLTLSYLPYSMGNNHPDSALVTRSQFSVLNAVLTYSYFRAKIMLNSMFMYSQSQAELAPGQLSGNILISGNQVIDYNNRLNLSFTYNASRFQFTTDTLNFDQCKFILIYKPSKSIQPQIGGDFISFKNGASKTTMSAGLNFKIKKSFIFKFNYGLSHLYRLWGFQDKYAHQLKGTILLNW